MFDEKPVNGTPDVTSIFSPTRRRLWIFAISETMLKSFFMRAYLYPVLVCGCTMTLM